MIDYMNNLFRKLFGRSNDFPPAPLGECFFRYFSDAVNVEWGESDQGFEAIFYEDGIEKIASFNAEGTLLELRVNLSLPSIPEPVKSQTIMRGEMMNAIRIHRGETLFYEIIYRDKELKRYSILFTAEGKIIKENEL
jgi:hypothetical protein